MVADAVYIRVAYTPVVESIFCSRASTAACSGKWSEAMTLSAHTSMSNEFRLCAAVLTSKLKNNQSICFMLKNNQSIHYYVLWSTINNWLLLLAVAIRGLLAVAIRGLLAVAIRGLWSILWLNITRLRGIHHRGNVPLLHLHPI
jgi:hypothetical protein